MSSRIPASFRRRRPSFAPHRSNTAASATCVSIGVGAVDADVTGGEMTRSFSTSSGLASPRPPTQSVRVIVTRSSGASGASHSTIVPSFAPTHAFPRAVGVTAVTVTPLETPGRSFSFVATPHRDPSSASQVWTSPRFVPVQSNALLSSDAIAVTSPRHVPPANAQQTTLEEGRSLSRDPPLVDVDFDFDFDASPPPSSSSSSTSARRPSSVRRCCRNRSYAHSVLLRLLAHHSSLPSTPAAHIARTSPPINHGANAPLNTRVRRSGPARSVLIPPFTPGFLFPVDAENPRAVAVVPPTPKPPTAPVSVHSCRSNVSKSTRSSSNLNSVARYRASLANFCARLYCPYTLARATASPSVERMPLQMRFS